MAYEHILFEEADGVATLTINRPERMNALHVGVIAEMIHAVDRIRDEGTARVLLMTGYADQRERATGLNAIVHDVVTKPFSVADIRTAVADALASRNKD